MPRLFAPRAKEEPAVETKPEPSASSGLSKDEVKELVSGAVAGVAGQLTETIARLGAKVEELATRQPQIIVQPSGAPVADTRGPDTTDQDIDAAVLSGQGAAARIRALVDKAVNNATQRLIDTRVKPLEEMGVSTLGELTRRVTTTGMKHYQKFKKEIDAQLATLTPNAQANPLVIETVYNAVVGQHADELAREAAEAAVRQAQETPAEAPSAKQNVSRSAAPGTGASSGTRPAADEVPDLEAYLGSGTVAGVEALQHKGSGGQNQDAFAQSMGYKNWAEYMKQYQELLAAETAGNA